MVRSSHASTQLARDLRNDTADHPAGNHLVLQTGEEEFVYLAHMQNGSIQVAVGDAVNAGDLLGLTGNSGNSSEPHLNTHAQNRPEYVSTEEILGLPLVFSEASRLRRTWWFTGSW